MKEQNFNPKSTSKLARKQKSYIWLVLINVILTATIFIGGFLFFKNLNTITYVDTKIGDETFKLELVNTDATRMKGLSERDGLEPNTGMLFDFFQEGDYKFWMNRMRFNIDIVWLSEQKQIVSIKPNASPDDFPERYSSDAPSRYVIEVNAGEFERLGLQPGDFVQFTLP